jgi:hypothetical protein
MCLPGTTEHYLSFDVFLTYSNNYMPYQMNHSDLPQKYIIFLTILLFSGNMNLLAQHGHDHTHHREFALIPSVIIEPAEGEYTWGTHAHLLFDTGWLDHRISIGAGAEYVAGDESHVTAGPVISMTPTNHLRFLYSPGITAGGEKGSREFYLSNHLEVSLEFELSKRIHIGPSAGINISGSHTHLSAGIHTGYIF